MDADQGREMVEGSEPATIVKIIDDDVREIWKSLDEKSGDPAKVADVIIDGIRRTGIIREEEEKRFIELVEIIEEGYRDLKRLALESEITKTSSVSIIEKKLPADIRRKWAEIVSADNSAVNKTNKFPSLLNFLHSQRRAIEYDTASLRVPAGPLKAVIHHTTAEKEIDMKGQRLTQGKCLIQEGGKHSAEECKVCSSQSLDEKKTLLKEKNACWYCLKVGHLSRVCRAKKTCNIKDCPLTHHHSLHEEIQVLNTSNTSGPTNVCRNTETDACLLQVQKIKTKRGVVRKLSKEELNTYKDAIHYISHPEALKPDSKSPPVTIVFNSNANYIDYVFNEYWAKEPDLLNSLHGILVRFRENEVAFIGDIKEMYHTVKTTVLDRHTHRFLWRDMVTDRAPDTYVIKRVSLGDKPSATIATMAPRKTAEMGSERYLDAAKIVKHIWMALYKVPQTFPLP
ncbi:hypothetical protein AWC38_SpisGene17602 [Stylophora pistillata]|uniref:CCHC-type domain-containing protein n=1 Tax=Stylophora pistillata TaxID=50429 RepID=A0A2B4RNX8_STYPI|nr:hypothetical protein AWC38_SpisGene17602 [Stylophora pistillata]